MKLFIVTLLLCITFQGLNAQVTDNFTDGNFNTNPTWIGDDSLFNIVSGELKLNGSIASDAHLVTDHNLLDSIVWTFYCRFDLSPSTQNFSRFYLVSDQQNLEGPLNGYYVQLGGVTGNTDSITLYRQNGTSRTRLIGGRPGTVSKSSNRVRIKVFRDNLGNWELHSDTTGANNYILEGTAIDNSITASNYLGWYVKYTAGNNQKYYLDDVKAQKPIADLTAPLIDSIKVSGSSSLLVYFNEPLDATSAQDLNNYEVTPALGNPVSVTLINGSQVTLQFSSSFVSKTNYNIAVQQVKDISGNTMSNYQLSFSYFQPTAFDLLISEFMPDPSPSIGLPEQEFIEIYNNSSSIINLAGYTISDGGTPAVFPNISIMPDSFIIVCSSAASAFLTQYGKLVVVSNMPSLNNTGDPIILKDNQGNIIHQLTYDLSWYQDAAKDDGGYTIELHYPKQLCKGKTIYAVSQHISGGTPGTYNSVWDTTPDIQAPGIASASAITNQQLMLVFNENADITSFDAANISIQPIVMVASIQSNSPDTLIINLQTPLSNNTSYILNISNVKDCGGNVANLQTNIDYYVPEMAENYDILIHEIMADPDPVQQLPNAEYIELYNRSSKIISLKNWLLGDDGGFAKLPDITLLPDSFIIITSTTNSVLFNGKVIGVTGFPSLGNDGDNLVLKNDLGKVVHAINYTSSWYADGFKKQGGFSLEMIDAQNPCGINNWKETNNTQGGTPGKANSVKGSNKDNITPRLIRAYVKDSISIELFFNESLDSTSFTKNHFLLSASVNPIAITGAANHYQSTVLHFNDTFSYGIVYSLMVDSIKDCAQNEIENYKSVDFERGQITDSGSVVINEVLFNAKTNAYDFVELYNKGNYPVDLKNLIIARRDASYALADMKFVAPAGFMLRPGEFAVLTEDPENLTQNYFCKNPALIIPVSLPSYSDDKGTVVLMNYAGVIYDEFTYDDKMHFALLDDKDGVSLERIDFNRPTNQRSNWTSAAGSSGYATPTYKNSQYLQTERSDAALKLSPNRISPDGDGYEDVMNINYSFSENGYIGNLRIYDANGRMVKQLLKNEVLGTNGTYTWDGITDSENKAPIGIYIFELEVFNLNGGTNTYKAVGVVAGKF